MRGSAVTAASCRAGRGSRRRRSPLRDAAFLGPACGSLGTGERVERGRRGAGWGRPGPSSGEGAAPGLELQSPADPCRVREGGAGSGLGSRAEVGVGGRGVFRPGDGKGGLALPPTAPRSVPRPHRVCLASARREESEDAYVQGDPAGASSDLRLPRLPNILPGGEMRGSVGAGSYSPCGACPCGFQDRESSLHPCGCAGGSLRRAEGRGFTSCSPSPCTWTGGGVVGHPSPLPVWRQGARACPRASPWVPWSCFSSSPGSGSSLWEE